MVNACPNIPSGMGGVKSQCQNPCCLYGPITWDCFGRASRLLRRSLAMTEPASCQLPTVNCHLPTALSSLPAPQPMLRKLVLLDLPAKTVERIDHLVACIVRAIKDHESTTTRAADLATGSA